MYDRCSSIINNNALWPVCNRLFQRRRANIGYFDNGKSVVKTEEIEALYARICLFLMPISGF